jgi:enediyne polyketide synthase
MAPSLTELAPRLPGRGLLVAVDREPGQHLAARLLAAARCADGGPVVFVQERGAGLAGGFARSMFLEAGGTPVAVVGVPFDDGRSAAWVGAEAASASGFVEVEYDEAGCRLGPALRALEPGAAGRVPLGPTDVVLVSGGGRGIAAECALALAGATGCALALLGRSDPAADPELRASLARFSAAGVRFHYARADVTDAAAVAAAVARVRDELGPITGLVHAAGTNAPASLRDLDEAAVAAALAPKLRGLESLLAAVEPGRLRLLAGFGSVIARSGLDGEAHYALANEWLRRRIERFAAEHPECRCRCLEWSVWSGTGMGERLGAVDRLRALGVEPIDPEAGCRALLDALGREEAPVGLVVSSRLDGIPTLRFAEAELPLLRFVERPEAHYPGVELVVDAELDLLADPYLEEHALGGESLLPAVVGLEAMCQVASSLAGAGAPAVLFRQVRFERPVVVPRRGARRLRVAATRTSAEEVAVAIRSDATGLREDHFRAVCRPVAPVLPGPVVPEPAGASGVELDPARDLYGSLLFQTGRFRRLRRYRALAARSCAAELGGPAGGPWFARHLPVGLLLGDPGVRDAAVHALQACVPHLVVLPVAVEEIWIGRCRDAAGCLEMRAVERAAVGRSFIWDLELRDGTGAVVEWWRGLRLEAVEERTPDPSWPAPLLAVCAERGVLDAGARRALV